MLTISEKKVDNCGVKKMNKIEKRGVIYFVKDWIKRNFGFDMNEKNLIIKNKEIRLNGKGIEKGDNFFIQSFKLLNDNTIIIECYDDDQCIYYQMDY
jgi:hypothetical protein